MTFRGNQRSSELLARACKVTPGGVNSPVRAFKSVGGTPVFIARSEGPYLFDVDGNRLIDYVGSWGPMILGHNSPVVADAIVQAVERGTSYGAPTELEVLFAEELCATLPGVEMIRFVSSGTEATMSAVRLARGFTGREFIVKFDGCYHGHGDSLLVAAGSGVATLGIAGSPGIPDATAKLTLSIEFNDAELLERTISELGADKIAAIIVEPIPGNMGLIVPKPEFLARLRELCTRHGIVLIFDEVMSGFRVALGGAAELYGITPDLSTFGKIIGGGLPVGAFGGRAEIMERLAPSGPVYQAGTLSGNPLAMSAGIAAFRYLRDHNPYPRLDRLSDRLTSGLARLAEAHEVSFCATHIGSMLGLYFARELPANYREVKEAAVKSFNLFFHEMLRGGVYLAPSAFEAGFMSLAHTEATIDETLEIAAHAFAVVRDRERL